MTIEVLGTGCPSCKKLEANVREAVKVKGIEADIKKITDMGEIMAFGIMSLPGIAIDGVIKSAGKVLTTEEVSVLL